MIGGGHPARASYCTVGYASYGSVGMGERRTILSEYTKSAAFFDLDRTLIRGSANFPLAWAAFKAGHVPKRQLLHDAINAATFLLGGASDERSARLRERILLAVAGVPVTDLVALGETFIPRLAASVMPEARLELDRQLAEGRDRVIVSASPIEIVDQIAQTIGLEGAVGTRGEIRDGRYTGKLTGEFCYGTGKVTAVRQLAAERGYDLATSVAYSDSISDIPFLEAVGSAVAINPDKALRRIARERGWQVIEVGRKAKQ